MNANYIDYHFTLAALERITEVQKKSLLGLAWRGATDCYVSVAFDLPFGYIGFVLEDTHGPVLNGGISPEGRVST